MRDLVKLRKQIDAIDNEMLDLLSKRFAVARKIGVLKKVQNSEIADQNREMEVVGQLSSQSEEKKVDPESIKQIWKVIISRTKNEEKQV